jgi:hypothetical protein
MKQKILFFNMIYCCFCLTVNSFAEGLALTPEIMEKLNIHAEIIKGWVKQPIIVYAVKAQNDKKISLDQIKLIDSEWIKIKKTKVYKKNKLMDELISTPTSKWLVQKNKDSRGKYPEIFLCDNQGANVAFSKIISDYWQGDEDKWIKSFNESKGKVVFGEPEYDNSSRAMQIQISVPVKDQEKAIGVLIVGVKFSKLK